MIKIFERDRDDLENFSISTVLVVLATQQALAIDVIAHRGYSCSTAENSVQSVNNAWQAGADGVEVDVRVSSDGIAYLFHDDEISNKKIGGLEYSTILSLSDEPIYELSEVLDASEGDGYYVFDLKTDKLTDVDAILNVVRTSQLTVQSVSFQSSSVESLKHVRQNMPSARLAFLSELKWKVPYLIHPSAKQLVNKLEGLDVDRVSIKGRSFVDKDFIDTIKASGRTVHIWTINDSERAAYYQGLGADGLITDRVEILLGENDCRINSSNTS